MAEVRILCPICHKPNSRTTENFRTAKFCQHCGRDIVLNNVVSGSPRYYITRVIKEGGQGAVYEAIDDAQKVIAVKEMLDRFNDPKERAEAVERFKEEADMLVRLSHPRIPRVYASFEDEQRHYLAMEFVRGEDLEDIIRREGSIDEARALAWAAQIFDVIEHLHRQSPPIIFRDMKPSNIMIERDGGVKVIDFGIAKMLQGTQRGTQIGTPGYAPPEQYQGLATVASDIYALAATLHHMLTGRDPRDEPPFSFAPVYGLKPTVSKRTSDAIQRALQMKPEDRWRSVAEFRAALIPTPQPAQVRVAPQPAAQPQPQPARPAQPQPAPPAQPARPAQPQPQAAQPTRPAQPQPQAAVPATSAARPAGAAVPQAQPAQPQQQKPQQQKPQQQKPQQPPAKPVRAGRAMSWLLIAVVALVLIGATVVAAFPNLLGQIAPVTSPQPAPTAQTLIQLPYQADLEVVVPSGGDVRAAFEAAYLASARAAYGDTARVNANAPLAYVGGDPVELSEDATGTKYQATMSGYILVPQ